MGQTYNSIPEDIAEWLAQQPMFFVATAPLSENGHVNCSPKGHDSFRVFSPNQVGYLDLTGSGAETAAHLRENGRITLLFCAFTEAPKIVRLYGKGSLLLPGTKEFQELESGFPASPLSRAIIKIDVTRVSISCGWGVPKFESCEQRDIFEKFGNTKSAEELKQFRMENNRLSIDGLPALPIE